MSADKQKLRIEAKRRRTQAANFGPRAAEEAAENAIRLLEQILSSPPEPPTAGLYHPVRDELSPLGLAAKLRSSGWRLALPFIQSTSRMCFRLWEAEDALSPGPYDIQQPAAECPEVRPDILIVPLLGFDRRGMRLGYGAGYYDRYICERRKTGLVVTIGFAFAEQEYECLPASPTDEALDWIVTQKETIQTRPP